MNFFNVCKSSTLMAICVSLLMPFISIEATAQTPASYALAKDATLVYFDGESALSVTPQSLYYTDWPKTGYLSDNALVLEDLVDHVFVIGGNVAIQHEANPAEHLLLFDVLSPGESLADSFGECFAVGHFYGVTFHTCRKRQPRLVFTTTPPMSHISSQTCVTFLGTGTGPIVPSCIVSGSSQSFPGSIFLIQK